MACQHLDEICRVEMATAMEHLSNHKWYKAIQDDASALSSFITEWGQYMREVYCSSLCSFHNSCDLACKYYNTEPHSNEPINLSLRKFYNKYYK